MKKKYPVLIILLFALIWTAVTFGGYETGQTYHGFKLQEKRFVKEVNAECLYFQHEKSGARLFKVVTDDINKSFSIAFKTVPQSDCGTPHIMEHSVLNGSKNFPVKSPFDVLSKGSLNTFLNAMTGSHVTIYPIASMNDKDYFNLMHVYLDAVFNPLIYNDPRIFKQEGWHHELTDKESPAVYKGVVYNEMKGAFSSADRELDYQIYKHLFPDNGYGYSSGGYPEAIPELTYETFLNFHKRFYHPDNSYIFLYGNADLDKELEFIDREYLFNYEKGSMAVSIPVQKPFTEMKEVIKPYPAAEGASTENQTYLSLSIVAGLNSDRALAMALDVLTDVLVNHESGPIRMALQEAGIGRDVNAAADDIKQNVFQIIVRNANPGDKDAFRDIVLSTLKKVADEGLDKKMVEGIINRMEFQLREGNTPQKGLNYNFQALSGWFFADDPFMSLEYEKPLSEIKKALKTDYLESIIREYLIDNPHSLFLVLEPKPGMEKEINIKISAVLAEYKAALSDMEMESLIGETNELIDYQKREDLPEAIATIPLLNLSDIDPKAEWFEAALKDKAAVPVLHFKDFTNNIVYVRFFFDARVLPVELIPYAALLAEVLGSLNTENYTFGELDNELNIHTGRFNTAVNSYLENQDDGKMRPKFIVSSKAMNVKLDKLFDLTGEILLRSIFDDQERLKSVLTRHQSRLDNRIKSRGLNYALTRLASYYSHQGMFNELTTGLDYFKFVTDLTDNFEEKFESIQTNLAKTAELLFSQGNMTAGVTCGESDYNLFTKELKTLGENLPRGQAEPKTWSFDFKKKNEGLKTASKVQYVTKGYDFKKLGYQWNGKMRVLDQILSSDWLQNQIRVIGGAYGGFSSFSSDGQVYFASYRDPNLTETLENYDATPEYLKGFQADEDAMTRYIIGTISRMDRPRTPSQKGDLAFTRYFEKTTQQQVQNERDAVIATIPEDIRQLETMVTGILKQNAYCVYGNEEKIESSKELFGDLIEIGN